MGIAQSNGRRSRGEPSGDSRQPKARVGCGRERTTTEKRCTMLTRRFTLVVALTLIASLALPVTDVVAQSTGAQTTEQAVHAEKSKTKTVTKTFTNSGLITIPGT